MIDRGHTRRPAAETHLTEPAHVALPTCADDQTIHKLETTINKAATMGCSMPNAANEMPNKLYEAARSRLRRKDRIAFRLRAMAQGTTRKSS